MVKVALLGTYPEKLVEDIIVHLVGQRMIGIEDIPRQEGDQEK